MSHGLLSKFPHDNFRYGQKYLTKKLDQAVKSDKVDFVIVEAPTGFGKTAVAGAIGHHHSPAYYLTEQKIHQDQMMEEFPRVTEIAKGQRNYCCGEERNDCVDPIPEMQCFRKPGTDKEGAVAAESFQRGELKWQKGLADPCPYFFAKTKAMESPIACLNYSYFFNETYYTGGAGTHGGDFGDRKVMICDEAHNIASVMQNFLTFRVDKSQGNDEEDGYNFNLVDEIGLELRDRGERISDWEPWILSDLRSAVSARLKQVNQEVSRCWENNEEVSYELKDRQDKLDEILCNINRFGSEYSSQYFDDMDWAVEREYDEEYEDLINVKFTPVSVAPFADRFLFDYADTVIMMSATILDFNILMRSLGLKRYEDRIFHVKFPSPFDASIRPVEYFDAPSVNHKSWAQTFPKTVQLIDNICQKPEHVSEKGIIHSVSYENEKVIYNNVSRSVRGRLLSHGDHNDKSREEVLEEFKKSKEPKILMSPAMYEGVDLKYDLSRFQIVPKVPFLSLGSKAVQYKKQKDPQWYDWRTAIRLVQSFGRSVRAEDDYAKTYVVDGSFNTFIERNGRFFPDYIYDEDNKDENALQKGDIRKLLEESYATQ